MRLPCRRWYRTDGGIGGLGDRKLTGVIAATMRGRLSFCTGSSKSCCAAIPGAPAPKVTVREAVAGSRRCPVLGALSAATGGWRISGLLRLCGPVSRSHRCGSASPPPYRHRRARQCASADADRGAVGNERGRFFERHHLLAQAAVALSGAAAEFGVGDRQQPSPQPALALNSAINASQAGAACLSSLQKP